MKSAGIPQTVVEQAISFLLALPRKQSAAEPETNLLSHLSSNQQATLAATSRR